MDCSLVNVQISVACNLFSTLLADKNTFHLEWSWPILQRQLHSYVLMILARLWWFLLLKYTNIDHTGEDCRSRPITELLAWIPPPWCTMFRGSVRFCHWGYFQNLKDHIRNTDSVFLDRTWLEGIIPWSWVPPPHSYDPVLHSWTPRTCLLVTCLFVTRV